MFYMRAYFFKPRPAASPAAAAAPRKTHHDPVQPVV